MVKENETTRKGIIFVFNETLNTFSLTVILALNTLIEITDKDHLRPSVHQ